jgi:hypothetical protein
MKFQETFPLFPSLPPVDFLIESRKNGMLNRREQRERRKKPGSHPVLILLILSKIQVLAFAF